MAERFRFLKGKRWILGGFIALIAAIAVRFIISKNGPTVTFTDGTQLKLIGTAYDKIPTPLPPKNGIRRLWWEASRRLPVDRTASRFFLNGSAAFYFETKSGVVPVNCVARLEGGEDVYRPVVMGPSGIGVVVIEPCPTDNPKLTIQFYSVTSVAKGTLTNLGSIVVKNPAYGRRAN